MSFLNSAPNADMKTVLRTDVGLGVPVADPLKPEFEFVKKLNDEPANITAGDTAGIDATGWDE